MSYVNLKKIALRKVASRKPLIISILRELAIADMAKHYDPESTAGFFDAGAEYGTGAYIKNMKMYPDSVAPKFGSVIKNFVELVEQGINDTNPNMSDDELRQFTTERYQQGNWGSEFEHLVTNLFPR